MKIKMTARRIFWLLLLLIVASAIPYRQTGFDAVNFSYKFSRLHWTKQKVLEVRTESDTIRIYTESYPHPVSLIEAEQLGVICRESYRDYYFFLAAHYPEIFYGRPDGWRKKSENLNFIFLSGITYEAMDRIMKRHDTAAVYLIFFNTIYFKAQENSHKIKEARTTIRHEIFHYLNAYYGLTEEFEEAAAQRFG